jgi:hypothetical protein
MLRIISTLGDYMLESINDLNDLKTAIALINVKDYGDFKRKAVLYINRFNDEKATPTQKKIFTAMIDRIQFHTNQDIEKTRNWALQELKKI